MVTAASSADAAVVLVDAIKLDWKNPALQLLPQTRRHALLLKLLRVPSVVFAINKLDAVADATVAFQNIAGALNQFAQEAGITVTAMVPISALKGWNVVDTENNGQTHWCGYSGPSLLSILEGLPTTPAETDVAFSFEGPFGTFDRNQLQRGLQVRGHAGQQRAGRALERLALA
jgi:sulfate adenylyltransferase subunit 1